MSARSNEIECSTFLNAGATMKYDELLKILNEFGTIQKIQTLIVGIVAVLSACHSVSSAFISASPEHRCKLPDSVTSALSPSTHHSSMLKHIKASRGNQSEDNTLRFTNEHDKCYLTVVNSSDWENGDRHPCLYGYEYSTHIYDATIVSDWDLVCEKAWQRGLAASIFFIGRLLGALIVSLTSDRYGRRNILFASLGFQAISGVATALSPNLWVFYPLYALQGIFQNLTYITAFVIGTEMVGPSYRKVTGLTMKICYAFGMIVLAGVAYLLPNWRHLEIAISIPLLFVLATYRFLPESVRWLLSQGRRTEADVIIQRMAKINKVSLQEDILTRLVIDRTDSKSSSIRNIFNNQQTLKVAISVWFCITINTLVYYGILLDITNLHGDPYLNFAIGGVIEIPAHLLTLFLLDRTGRKPLLIIYMIVGGVSLLVNAFIPSDLHWLSIVLLIIGRFTITASYAISYLMTAEVFPTVARAAGVSIGNMMSRGGGILAPQIVVLGELFTSGSVRLQYVLFGGLSILAVLMVTQLPEPTNRPLPQTFNDLPLNRKDLAVAEIEMESVHHSNKSVSI